MVLVLHDNKDDLGVEAELVVGQIVVVVDIVDEQDHTMDQVHLIQVEVVVHIMLVPIRQILLVLVLDKDW